jgi:tRNA-dihydrouridine synthase
MYHSEVHYDFIARAAAAMTCPVLANGNIDSARTAEEVLKTTGARGLMIGRGAIRNPWLFQQIRQQRRGEPLFVPSGREVLNYIRALYDAVCSPDVRDLVQVQKMKKYLNFIGLGVEPTGQFLHQIRRVSTRMDFFRVCEEFLDHNEPMPLEPFRASVEKAAEVLAV